MPTLARINGTPIKGTALQQVKRVALGEAGIAGNRRFHLIDEQGRLFSGSSFGSLVQVVASHDPIAGVLTCRFPDGSTAEGPDDNVGTPHETDFYGRPVPGHRLGGPFDEAFATFIGRPVSLIRTDRDGDGADVFPLTVISHASVADLGRRGDFEGDLDPLRFRIDLELAGSEPFEEDSWDGMRVRVGTAVVRISGQIPRCVVTTQDARTGVHDWNTLKQIAAFRPLMADRTGIPFGVYATVEDPGEAALGDEVALLET